ncbi:MAG: Bug family tripartite tricarboxylate transporter substrate binding protein [Lautropia sp.]
MRRFYLGATAALIAVLSAPALAQSGYPSKPIRWVVGYPPGGGVDIIARTIAAPLSANLGQQVVVENRPGATGMIAADMVAKSAPDGYTIASSGNQDLVLNPLLNSRTAYDPQKDFEPLTLVAKFPLLLVVNGSVPVTSFKDFIAYAKANPGKINYASFGNGSGNHVGMEILKRMTGVDMVHVPYKGAAPALTDLVGGAVQAMLLDYGTAVKHIPTGKIRALAVATNQQLAAMPQVPTIAELGVEGFDVFFWQGVVVPAGVPAEIRDRLHRELLNVMARPDVRARFDELGILLTSSTPAQLVELQRRDTARWGAVIKEMDLRLD